MSVEATSWVWNHSSARGNDRLVLLVIADHVSRDRPDAFPSQATMARMARLSERTVRRCIRSLEELGEVVTTLHGGNGARADRVPNSYRLVLFEPQVSTGGQSVRADMTGRTGGQNRSHGRSAVAGRTTMNRKEPARAREECPEHRGQLLRSCSLCRAEQIGVG